MMLARTTILVTITVGFFSFVPPPAAAAPSVHNTATPAATPARPDSSVAVADTVHWVALEEGIKASRDNGKPVFLFCYGSWCGYSQKMIARTFHDSLVVRYLNAYFTPIKVETRSTLKTVFNGVAMTESQIANREFGVTAVPCVWLLESGGCRIKKIKGYYPAKYLLPELQAIVDRSYVPCRNVPLQDMPVLTDTKDSLATKR